MTRLYDEYLPPLPVSTMPCCICKQQHPSETLLQAVILGGLAMLAWRLSG